MAKAPWRRTVAANSSRNMRTSIAGGNSRLRPTRRRMISASRAGRRAAIAPLRLGDARNDVHALDQQILQPFVDLVDAPAQLFEIGRAFGHGSDRCRDGLAVASGSGKIKENVDMPGPRSLPKRPLPGTAGTAQKSPATRAFAE